MFMLRERLMQISEPAVGEGNCLLVGGSVGPEAAILGFQSVSQQFLVLTEDFGTGDGDGGS